MKVKGLILLSLFYLNLKLCLGQSPLLYEKSQTLSYKDLNFNEVFGTLTDAKDNIWMLGGNDLCRNTGHDIDCFPLPIDQARSMFFIGEDIIVIVDKTQSKFCYFDLKTYCFKNISVPESAILCRNSSLSNQLYFIFKGDLLKFDFIKNSYNKEKKLAHFPNTQFVKYFMTSNGSIASLSHEKLAIDDKIFPIDKIDVINYLDFVELKDCYLVNSGRDLYSYDIMKASFVKIYSDNFDCKKIWKDKVGNVLLAIPQPIQCNIISKLYLLKPDVSVNGKLELKEDLGYLIDEKDYESTIINCNSNDFTKGINFATHMGMYSYIKHDNAYCTILTVNNKTSRFGRVLKGIVKDKLGNVYYSGEENNIYIQKVNNTIDTIAINVILDGKMAKLTNGKSLIYDSDKSWIYGVSGQYKKRSTTLYALDIKSRKVIKYWPIKNRISSMMEHQRKIYMATSDKYVFTFDMNTMLLDTLIAFKDESIRTKVCYVSNNDLLIGTDNGLISYNLLSNKLSSNTELGGISIIGITESSNDLYIASNITGLYIIDKVTRKVKLYDKANGLSGNSVNIATVLNNGNIVVSTENGLNIINVKEKLVLPLTKDKINISNNEFNTLSYLIEADKLYFGTVNGATIIDKNKLDKSNNYLANISKLVVHDFGKETYNIYLNVSNFIFSPLTQKLVIHFGSFNKSNKISFAYRINNSDHWMVIEHNKLELIRPLVNTSKMEVKCTDLNGIWSEKSTIFTIEVQQHFYNKQWFYILITTLISALVFLFSKWRIKELKSHQKEILAVNKRILELNLVALQSQMNPHFLFNAMSSIQYYLKTNNILKAEEVLSSFGKLIRRILESSKVKTWTLEEEISLLQNYIEIEKEKFEKDEIQINFDLSHLKNKNWLIPPMLIQPFIENAFKHAYVMMEAKALLNIIISDNNDLVRVSIMDNGIGIDTLLKKKKDASHTSLGMDIIRERIQLYNEESTNGKITFSINADDKKIKNGTLIELYFPKTLN